MERGVKKGFMGKVALELSLRDGWDWYTWRRQESMSEQGHSMTKGNRGSKGVVGNKPKN